MPRGGKRIGAGRKKSVDPTITIRIPLSMKNRIQQWVHSGCTTDAKYQQKQESIKHVLSVLQYALSLKANAGGKIKTEIRKAIDTLNQLI